MSPAESSLSTSLPRPQGAPLRIAFAGAGRWLATCAPPPGRTPDWTVAWFNLRPLAGESGASTDDLAAFAPQVTVLFDPAALAPESLAALPGVTLGVLVGDLPDAAGAASISRLHRLVSFRGELTGAPVASTALWRAVPPPVSDLMFRPTAEVAAVSRTPLAMSIGRSTEHREAMLTPAKHHHELLHLIDGIYGQELIELMGEFDVAVHVPAEPGTGFGSQIPLHLAAGQLLLSGDLAPAHGLERNIDYLQIDSPEGIVWVLERLRRFPDMHRKIRIRGRLKAEQYRASFLFARLAHDLLADVRAFGADVPVA